MSRIAPRGLAVLLSVTMILAAVPSSAFAADPARLEGYVVGVDGRPAAEHAVLLIDGSGAVADRAVSGDDGIYRFAEVAPGEYGVGLELPDGTAVAVVDAPAKLAAGELARRDIRLSPAEPGAMIAPGRTHAGLGVWWAGLSGAAKAGVIIGAIGAGWLIWDALDSDDDDEPCASPPCG